MFGRKTTHIHAITKSNRQAALDAAVARMEGLRPSGVAGRYSAENLAPGVLELADKFLEWLEK